MKKVLTLVLVIALCLSIAACGGNNGSPSPASNNTSDSAKQDNASNKTVGINTVLSDETLTVALEGEPSTLLAQTVNMNNEATYINGLILDRLVTYDPETGVLSPSFATAWEWIDETHLKFTLRDDVYAADGSKLTANDVLFTIKTGIENKSTYYATFDADNTVVESDDSIIIAFNKPDPSAIYTFGGNEVGILSESCVNGKGGFDAASSDPVVGSGKYTFKEWKRGEYVLLERNDNYWDDSYKGYYQYIKFTFVADSATRIMAVQSGDAQVATDVPLVQSANIDPSTGAVPFQTASVQSLAVVFNCAEGPFADKRVREAARLLIDVDAVNAVYTLGMGTIERGYISTGCQYYTDPAEGEDVSVNIEKAKELLTEAGYPDGFTCDLPVQAKFESAAVVVQNCLSKAGITANITTPDSSTIGTVLINGEYDLYVGQHQNCVIRLASNFVLVNPTQIGITYGGPRFPSDELTAYITAVDTTLDDGKLAEAYANIQQFLWDNCLIVNICSSIQTAVASSDIGGLSSYPRIGVDVTYAHPVN